MIIEHRLQNAEDRRSRRIWAISAILIFITYVCIAVVEIVYGAGNTQLIQMSIAGGIPLVILSILIFMYAPKLGSIPLFSAILWQIGFLAISVFIQRLTSYFFIMLIITGVFSLTKSFKQMAGFLALGALINILFMIFFIPRLEGIAGYNFFLQLLMTQFASIVLLIQTYNVVKKEGRSDRALEAFSSLLRSTPNFMVITDSQTKVRYISKKMAEFAFFSRQELAVDKPLLDLFSDKKLKLMFADILEADGFVETVMTIDIGGEERHFKVVADKFSSGKLPSSKMLLTGDAGGMFIDISDITGMVESQKAAEDAKEKAELANAAKSNFLASMSHEIRTPMNAITGMSELLLRRDIPEEARADAQDIKQAASNLISIINDILDLSKIEAGKLEIFPIKYILSSLINDVVNIIRMRLLEKPIRFYTNIDGKIPNNLIGDEVRLRQIILNLLSNAAKFTEKGCISMSITIDKQTDEKVWLKIVITDTGFGIKPEEQTKLFTDFEQLDIKKTRTIEGTGLGLAITKRLCAAMGGDINAVSEYGKGSEFTVIIPQELDSKIPLAEVDEPERKKVLVYEGRVVYAESVCWSLKNMGVPHKMVTNYNDFAEALNTEWYCIFSGYGLYDKIKPLMELIPNEKRPALALMVEWGTEAYIPNVRFISLPIQSLSIANTLNGKDDRRDFFINSASTSINRFTFPKARILVVDDLTTNLKVAEGLLAPYMANVDTCLSGWEAIEKVKRQEYDLVFMDHMMPEMDGIEATVAMRELKDPRFKTMPIVALTANAVSGMRELFLEKGFSDFLAKPIDVSKLDEILNRWIPKDNREKKIPDKEEKKERAEAVSGDLSLLSPNPSRTIPGINLQNGIVMTGGTEAGYLKVLPIFCKDAEERLLLLESPAHEPDFPEILSSQMHALKSASGAIGAAELSAQAGELEAAGKAGDFAFIEKKLPVFTEGLSALIKNIREFLESKETANKDSFSGETQQKAFLSFSASRFSLIADLLSALESENTAEIDHILEGMLEKAPDSKIKEILKRISDHVLMADYEKAKETLRALSEL